jgi:hypothetical protein
MGEAGGTMAAAQLIGGTSSLANGYSQSQAYKMQGRFQKQLAGENAQLAELQAKDAEIRSASEVGKVALRATAMTGAQRASFGNQGVDVNVGSAAAIQADTAGMSALDQLTIRNNAARQAWGYGVQGMTDTYQGKMSMLAAQGNANSTMLTGGLGFLRGATMAAYSKNKNVDDTPDYSTPGVS